jgi:hypothetical protein
LPNQANRPGLRRPTRLVQRVIPFDPRHRLQATRRLSALPLPFQNIPFT